MGCIRYACELTPENGSQWPESDYKFYLAKEKFIKGGFVPNFFFPDKVVSHNFSNNKKFIIRHSSIITMFAIEPSNGVCFELSLCS